ncbi:MAG: TRAP transporter large permease [bacterium]
MNAWPALLMFFCVAAVLLSGYPVAFSLGGVALLFAGLGHLTGQFDISFLHAFPNRLFGIMSNETLMAVPLFVLMGLVLERSKVANDLLENMSQLMGSMRGGLGYAVMIVGLLLAASTGIVGATVVTMGVLSLPTMLKKGYDPSLACGSICASGTLGQIIPPSIVLVLLGDVISNAYQQSQLNQGIFTPKSISVGDLFVAAIIPGLMLVGFYLIYLWLTAHIQPKKMPLSESDSSVNTQNMFRSVMVPMILIVSVLGSIISGIATPTEAAALGAVGSLIMTLVLKRLDLSLLKSVAEETLKVSSMVFAILIGAALFSLVFRGFGGDDAVHHFLINLPGGKISAILVVMLTLFLLGFILDFIEITFVVIPIVGPILLSMGFDPLWLGIMVAINLQTSFLTPPFGFALFYLRGVAPAEISTRQIYRGVVPFIAIQLFTLLILAIVPELITWLPGLL